MATSQGVKILGKDLEKTLAGLPLLVANKEDEVAVLKVKCKERLEIKIKQRRQNQCRSGCVVLPVE